MSPLLLFLTAVAAAPADDAPAGRTNVVLIMADDLGAECLSSYGAADYRTPNLDDLAASGARFTNGFSTPLCTPSRVQIMTGKYNFRNYVQFGYLPPDETTFGDLFRAAGYRTCIAGKWQLSGERGQPRTKSNPADWGFDEHCLWQLDDRQSRYWDPLLEQNGEVVRPGPDVYGPDVVNDYLLDFLGRNKDRPFFAYYPMMLTHGPFDPTPDSAERGKANTRYFKDMVEYMDTLLGRLVARLDELGLRERTVIVFTGDNGTGRGIDTRTAFGTVPGGKGTTTDAGMRVPFIVNWPGKVGPNVTDDRLVDFTDVIPSLLAATGVSAPTDFKADGVPFLAAGGLSDQRREWTYSWYDPRQAGQPSPNSAVFARNHRYKLYADGRFLDVSKPWSDEPPVPADDAPPDAAAAKAKLQAVLDRFAAEGGVLKEAPQGERRGRRRARAAAAE